MSPSLTLSDALAAFDVDDELRAFLVDTVANGYCPPDEKNACLGQGFWAEAKDFNALVDCATSIHQSRIIDPNDLEGNDVLTSLWHVLQGTTQELNPWRETDRLIAKAQKLEKQAAQIERSTLIPSSKHHAPKPPKPHALKRQRIPVTSHYWSNQLPPNAISDIGQTTQTPTDVHKSQPQRRSTDLGALYKNVCLNKGGSRAAQPTQLAVGQIGISHGLTHQRSTPDRKRGGISPYFASPPPSQKKPSSKRPPPGTISCLPFPSLMSPSFGLVQEKFARDPFWLLVAVTFLIRTKGMAAVPVFLAFKARFPTPEDVADPANAQEIVNMIRHLGLSAMRLGILQRYARLFIDAPPRAGKVYRVRNYDRREIDVSLAITPDLPAEDAPTGMMTPSSDDEDHTDAWEIGHMTQGKYAIDSWRIFCRDELLGRAEDWTGKGREGEFQPEWMRVMPDDKELRAYLRWMWMREGWEWDAATGERKPLREPMRRAVNEGRVEFDDTGGLRILAESEAISEPNT